MAVYRVQGDIAEYAIVGCNLGLQEKLPILKPFRQFRTMKDGWKQLACAKIGEKPLGHFAEFNLTGGMPVVFPEVLARPELGRFLRNAGELLPITVDGSDAFALNVTRTFDACDRERSPMHALPDGQPATHWPVFKRSGPSGIGLFRIKESQFRLYLADLGDETGFYSLYQKYGLAGLTFEEQPVSG